MNEEIKDTVFCLALVALVRNIRTNLPKVQEDMTSEQLSVELQPMVNGLKRQVANILIEHLPADDIAMIAAGDLAQTISRLLAEFAELSMAVHGSFSMERLVRVTEAFCLARIGREIKV